MRVLVMDSHSSLHIALPRKKVHVSKRSVYMYPGVDFIFVIYDLFYHLHYLFRCADPHIELPEPDNLPDDHSMIRYNHKNVPHN